MSVFEAKHGAKREVLPGESVGGRVPCEACLSIRQHKNDRFLKAKAMLGNNNAASNNASVWGQSLDPQTGAAGEGSSVRRRRRRRSSGMALAGVLALALAACCPTFAYG